MGYVTINSGDYIEASWANSEVRDQVVTPFSSSTTRNTTITSAVPGMVSTLTTGTATEGIYQYTTASSWRQPWNLPWGYRAISATPAGFNFDNSLDYSSTFTWTAVENRWYSITLSGDLQNSTVTGGNIGLGMYTSANALVWAFPSSIFSSTNERRLAGGSFVYDSTSTGTLTWKIGAVHSASATTQTYSPSSIIIQDMGPSGPPVA